MKEKERVRKRKGGERWTRREMGKRGKERGGDQFCFSFQNLATPLADNTCSC